MKMEAFIYIPGLGTRLFDQSVESFAYRFKKALDINDEDPSMHYDADFRKVNFGKDNRQTSNVATIYAGKNGVKKPVFEIYELDYGNTLVDNFEKKNIVVRMILLFAAILFKFPEMIYQFAKSLFIRKGRRSTLSFKHILQFTYAALALLLLSIFGIMLVISVLSYLPDLLKANNIVFPAVLDHYIVAFRSFINAKFIILASTLIMLFMPNVKNFISILATEYVCTIYYLNFGERRQNIIGKLEELAEHIAERSATASINVVSFSFGSIIACDSLFPADGRPSRRLASIPVLITIGSPIDFINAYWPKYFKDRAKANNGLKHWYNVYSASDILSSNFRYDDLDKPAEYSISKDSIKPENITYNIINTGAKNLSGLLFLGGLRANQLYWDDELNSASCLTALVQQMKAEGIPGI